eukprot:1316622-Rhodomonas_salina.1
MSSTDIAVWLYAKHTEPSAYTWRTRDTRGTERAYAGRGAFGDTFGDDEDDEFDEDDLEEEEEEEEEDENDEDE